MIFELIEDLSKKDLVIIHDNESLDAAEEFKDKLSKEDIEPMLFDEDDVDIFNKILSSDKCILVFSKSSQSPEIREMIIEARRKNLKVYGVYDNFRGSLALLSDKYYIANEYDDFLKKFFILFKHNYDGKTKPMPQNANVFSHVNGMIIRLNVAYGDEVKKGSVLGIIESMKMEVELISDKEGIVLDIFVASGDVVTIGDPIMCINEE